MTPTRKGCYPECKDCKYLLKEDTKYPCSFSHKKIRIASNETLERNFKKCGKFEL